MSGQSPRGLTSGWNVSASSPRRGAAAFSPSGGGGLTGSRSPRTGGTWGHTTPSGPWGQGLTGHAPVASPPAPSAQPATARPQASPRRARTTTSSRPSNSWSTAPRPNNTQWVGRNHSDIFVPAIYAIVQGDAQVFLRRFPSHDREIGDKLREVVRAGTSAIRNALRACILAATARTIESEPYVTAGLQTMILYPQATVRPDFFLATVWPDGRSPNPPAPFLASNAYNDYIEAAMAAPGFKEALDEFMLTLETREVGGPAQVFQTPSTAPSPVFQTPSTAPSPRTTPQPAPRTSPAPAAATSGQTQVVLMTFNRFKSMTRDERLEFVKNCIRGNLIRNGDILYEVADSISRSLLQDEQHLDRVLEFDFQGDQEAKLLLLDRLEVLSDMRLVADLQHQVRELHEEEQAAAGRASRNEITSAAYEEVLQRFRDANARAQGGLFRAERYIPPGSENRFQSFINYVDGVLFEPDKRAELMDMEHRIQYTPHPNQLNIPLSGQRNWVHVMKTWEDAYYPDPADPRDTSVTLSEMLEHMFWIQLFQKDVTYTFPLMDQIKKRVEECFDFVFDFRVRIPVAAAAPPRAAAPPSVFETQGCPAMLDVLLDPVTGARMTDPVVWGPCGHVFDRSTVVSITENTRSGVQPLCPLDRSPIGAVQYPVRALNDLAAAGQSCYPQSFAGYFGE